MNFSPRQEGGENGDDSDNDFNFTKVDTIHDKTQNQAVLTAKILISKQDEEFNQNH
jgi:hypothetical protein